MMLRINTLRIVERSGWSVLFVFFAITPAFAGTARIRLGVEDEHHGEHLQGEIYDHQLTIHNDGDAELVLSKVTPSCSCMDIQSYPPRISPGGSGSIEMTINTKKIKPGDTRKRLWIFTNDPYTPKAAYWFTCDVISLVRTSPREIQVAGVHDHVKQTRVELLANSDLGFEILELKSREGKFAILSWAEVEKDRRYHATLEVGGVPKPGKDKGILDMTIRVRDGRTVTVGSWVEIDHRDHIELAPADVLRFSNHDTDKLLQEGAPPVTKRISVTAALPETSFEVKSVRLEKVPEGVFTTEVKPVVEGKHYVVTVILSEYQKKTYLSGKVLIETTDPRKPELSVDLQAMFGKTIRRRK